MGVTGAGGLYWGAAGGAGWWCCCWWCWLVDWADGRTLVEGASIGRGFPIFTVWVSLPIPIALTMMSLTKGEEVSTMSGAEWLRD